MSSNPLNDFRPPKAPPALRQRTLAAARAALEKHQQQERPATWVDRWWLNRPLRLAWSAAVLLLLAANVLLTVAAPLESDPQTATLAHKPSAPTAPPQRDAFLPASPALERLAAAEDDPPTWADSRELLRTLHTQETF